MDTIHDNISPKPVSRFTFTENGLEVLIPFERASITAKLFIEHPESGDRWEAQRRRSSDRNYESWLIAYAQMERIGVYQLRYMDDANTSRVLGNDLAQLISSDSDRQIAESFFQNSQDKYRARIYVPYTRKSVRLKVERLATERRSGQIEHLTLRRIERKHGNFVIQGTAFVPGIASIQVKPILVLRDSQNSEIARIEGKRARSLGNQKKYGFPDCDYTYSGFVFRIPPRTIAQKKELHAPARVGLSIALLSNDGTEYERVLKSTPKALGSKTRTIASTTLKWRKTRFSIISAEKSDELHISHRNIEDILSYSNQIKRFFAVKFYNFLGKPKSNSWLLYEFEASAAQDNAIVLFKYLQNNKPNINSKFIINRANNDKERLQKYGNNIIYKNTFRHYWALLTAKILISSQSRYHGYRLAPPKSDPIAQEMSRTPFIFLQHGVIALKKIGFHRKNPRVACDLFFCSTRAEQKIICEEYGYSADEAPIVGLPRFDRLKDRSSDYAELLVMPTWRKRLQNVNREVFANSDFFKKYNELLHCSNMEKLCIERGLRIKLYLHPVIAKHIDCFSPLPDHVDIVYPGEEPINELMTKARVLITDYSSVAWDFMYMKKPVVFFQFDLNEYNQDHGSYFDLQTDLGNASVSQPSDVFTRVTAWLDGETWTPPEFSRFEHYDGLNCERALRTIEDFLAKHG